MTADSPETDEHPELRALLVRLLIETGPGAARVEQLLAAMEQGVRLAREGPSGESYGGQSELAGLKAEIAALRQSLEHAMERTPSAGPPLEELLARSDSQLAALLAAAEKRAQAQLAQLSAQMTTQLSTLAERVSVLEAQLSKRSGSR